MGGLTPSQAFKKSNRSVVIFALLPDKPHPVLFFVASRLFLVDMAVGQIHKVAFSI